MKKRNVCALLVVGSVALAQPQPGTKSKESTKTEVIRPTPPPDVAVGQATPVAPSTLPKPPDIILQGHPTIPPAPPLAVRPEPVPMPVVIPQVTVPVAPPKPDDMTIDQLIAAVEELRTQKAEMEKREAALMKALHQKAAAQKAKIDGLGVPSHGDQIPPTIVPTGNRS